MLRVPDIGAAAHKSTNLNKRHALAPVFSNVKSELGAPPIDNPTHLGHPSLFSGLDENDLYRREHPSILNQLKEPANIVLQGGLGGTYPKPRLPYKIPLMHDEEDDEKVDEATLLQDMAEDGVHTTQQTGGMDATDQLPVLHGLMRQNKGKKSVLIDSFTKQDMNAFAVGGADVQSGRLASGLVRMDALKAAARRTHQDDKAAAANSASAYGQIFDSK